MWPPVTPLLGKNKQINHFRCAQLPGRLECSGDVTHVRKAETRHDVTMMASGLITPLPGSVCFLIE